jgi:hypothetical protein
MDYCPLCRRHLNGALVCAGCGSPATELRQRPATAGVGDDAATGEHSAYARQYAPRAEPAVPFDDEGPVPYGRVPDDAQAPAATDGPAHDTQEAPAATGPVYLLDAVGPADGGDTHRAHGRSGRRARSKRTRRLVTGALGLVLAGAALSLAQLATDTPHGGGGRARSVTDDSTALDFDGAPGASERPAVPGPPLRSPGSGAPDAVDAGATGTAPGPSGSASASPGGPSGAARGGSSRTTAGASGTAGDQSGGTQATGGGAGASAAGPSGGTPGGGRPPSTGASSPSPGQGGSGNGGGGGGGTGPTSDPSPTHCTHVLFWCT